MSDLISRQEAIEWVKNLLDINRYYHPHSRSEKFPISEVIDVLERIPNAEPERKTGHWIYEGKRGRFPACRCSECGNVENADWAILGDNVNYCPNCGAYMIEVKEAEK